ncbi:hypothetical protein EDD11_002357 [Mortierella claussenii]|nr:hypothetical protein EDD11_002357 [Mortierella claussenii]
MGNAVSRDHAKLPFGYTHARKDHSFNTSSVSRRRLASRLLRTSDTTSVTPFPMQDGSSSVASIPELVEISPVSLFIKFGTGTGAAVIVSAPVPESDTLETAVRSSSLRRRSSATAPEAMSPSAARSQYAAAAAHGNAHAILKNAGQAPALTTSAPGSSLAWSTSSHQAGMTNSDVAHAAITDDSTAPSSPPSSSIAGCEQGSCGSSLDQKQRISESEGTLERHSKDMDIISALGIADRPHQYDFFSTPSSPPSSLAAQPAQSHQQRPSMLTKQDSMALFVSGSRILEMHRQGDLETRTESTAIRADFRSHPSYKRTLSYELKMTERELQRLHEEDEEFCDSWDANTLQLEGCPGGETDSILDEDLEQLNPIPFAELPNLTNIGLCSHGIVKLSSNIRLLASATCVQM